MEQLKTLHRFKYDIIGICETRAREEQRMVWKDTGDELIIGGGSGTHHLKAPLARNPVVRVVIELLNSKLPLPEVLLQAGFPPTFSTQRTFCLKSSRKHGSLRYFQLKAPLP
ncbi:hypothetical protein Y032_0128g1455 [Ancylostoma ceylanicum]|uniref:Uncharacterized protein n=1 Tax=Ancylostoma ceylanicum TaxID=53326 RepID=A0A016T7W6_9BILA|nr:hypothetical protein Y032_0128g1455 [Ancylostoma ceylanicum]